MADEQTQALEGETPKEEAPYPGYQKYPRMLHKHGKLPVTVNSDEERAQYPDWAEHPKDALPPEEETEEMEEEQTETVGNDGTVKRSIKRRRK